MPKFNITRFFDKNLHSYLLDTLRKFHIPIPVVKWVKSFLQGHKAAICLDGKHNELKEVRMGVPQGSCASPILAAYFTAPLGDSIKQGFESTIQQDPELSSALNPLRNSLAPLTLYVDDGSIAASAQDQTTTSKMVEIAFREAHQWLTARGLKLDQVKNELIHFTRSRRGRHAGDGPSVTIPTNTPGEPQTSQQWRSKPQSLLPTFGWTLDSKASAYD